MKLKYLLFQMRVPGDPMLEHEVSAFTRAVGCAPGNMTAIDLIRNTPSPATLKAFDMILIGGSGDFSVSVGGPWLERALDTMRELCALCKPTFASCWGFQALARALGGSVVTDYDRAEIGTLELKVTPAGRADPVFQTLGVSFYAHVGHHDTVDILPAEAIHLVSSAEVEHHAFRIAGKPIYATQFHPELRKQEMVERLQTYPQYVHNISGMTVDKFIHALRESPQANNLLRTFIAHVFGD